MTIKQAQKRYSDAVEIKIAHESNIMTEVRLKRLAKIDDSMEVLFIKIGKTVSRIIYLPKF